MSLWDNKLEVLENLTEYTGKLIKYKDRKAVELSPKIAGSKWILTGENDCDLLDKLNNFIKAKTHANFYIR